jgi:hypothetical protein
MEPLPVMMLSWFAVADSDDKVIREEVPKHECMHYWRYQQTRYCECGNGREYDSKNLSDYIRDFIWVPDCWNGSARQR